MADTSTNILLTDAAKSGVESAHRRTRMPRVAMWERLGEWFGRQGPELQNVVLGIETPASERAILEMLIRRLETDTADPGPGLDAAQARDSANRARSQLQKPPGSRRSGNG